MSKIEFYIPSYEKIPTDLRLIVDYVYITYERIENGFRFFIDEYTDKAMEIAQIVVNQMIADHDLRGISWETISLKIIPQEEHYKVNAITIIEWKYRVRDSY